LLIFFSSWEFTEELEDTAALLDCWSMRRPDRKPVTKSHKQRDLTPMFAAMPKSMAHIRIPVKSPTNPT
jgi:hypothetical protein